MIQNRWAILFALFVARTALALQFQSVGSAAPFLIAAFAIDYASIGLLIGLHSLPGIAIAIPGGVIGQRFGAKRVALVGLALMTLGGVIMGFGPSFVWLAVGRTMLGTGAVLFNVLATKMITDWFAGREIATAMGTFVSSWPLGIALGLVVFGPLGSAYGWSAVMHVSTVCVIAGFAVVALAYRDPPGTPPAGPARLRLDLDRREWTLVCIAGAIWALFNVGYIVLVSFGSELFTQRGYSLTQASFLMSLVGWTLIPAIPLASFVAERSGRPRVALLSAFIILALALAILPFIEGIAFLATFAIIVLTNGVPPGLVMALPAQSLRAETRAGGMGVYYAWYYAGMAFLPGGAGLARDVTASAAAPILFAAAMMASCVVALILFNTAQRSLKQ